jgi:glycosyltransferase involved in cell wall biosynthesis
MVNFSIIVPVYQAQQYLERLIESVLAQDYTSYELILVDDGSHDGSANICDKFSDSYANIITIHKRNGGVSSARNEGIRRARGKYMIFLDADDYVDEGYLSDAAAVIEKYRPDILFYGYNTESKDGKEKSLPALNGAYTKSTLAKEFATIVLESSFNSAWNKIFCTNIIQEQKIEFPMQQIAEDGIFICRYLQYAKSFYFVRKTYYNYCQNEGSTVHKFIASRWIDENNYLKEVEKCVQSFASDQISIIMGIKYRNAILFDLYNLLESNKSILECSRILQNHLQESYQFIDWNIDTQDQMLKLQVRMLQRRHTFGLIALMRMKRRLLK